MTECQCADPAECGGCDPTPDWRWLCQQYGCRVGHMADAVRGYKPVWFRPPIKHRQAVAARKAAQDGDAQALSAGGGLFQGAAA